MRTWELTEGQALHPALGGCLPALLCPAMGTGVEQGSFPLWPTVALSADGLEIVLGFS
jgi:hypothetical protein